MVKILKQMTQEVFQQFFEWKSVKAKKLICVRNNMGKTLQILADWFSDILQVRRTINLSCW